MQIGGVNKNELETRITSTNNDIGQDLLKNN